MARQYWKDRFKAVVLGAGYSAEAAEKIVEERLDEYRKDLDAFLKMLVKYEQDSAAVTKAFGCEMCDLLENGRHEPGCVFADEDEDEDAPTALGAEEDGQRSQDAPTAPGARESNEPKPSDEEQAKDA